MAEAGEQRVKKIKGETETGEGGKRKRLKVRR